MCYSQDMDTKTCTKCHETKPLDAFGKRKLSHDGLNYWCKPCMTQAVDAATAKKAEQYRRRACVYSARYREANPTCGTEWKRANPDRVKASNDKKVAELKPAYLAKKLRIPVAQLTPELLELKRQQLELHRLQRQLQKLLKEKS